MEKPNIKVFSPVGECHVEYIYNVVNHKEQSNAATMKWSDDDMREFAKIAFLTGQGMNGGNFNLNKELADYEKSKALDVPKG